MEEIKKPEVKIEIDENTAQGVYVNLAMIGHSGDEFIIDFIFLQPQNPKAKVRSRIITSPGHVKRLMAALKDNITKYEARFGEIKVTPRPEDNRKVGFYH
ncbi:MAG: DUF3467 domain-containing protein [Endomicrobiales bacterium]|nr:DUF3467 domain-containing protein [Endomicrobiales bacterium]